MPDPIQSGETWAETVGKLNTVLTTLEQAQQAAQDAQQAAQDAQAWTPEFAAEAVAAAAALATAAFGGAVTFTPADLAPITLPNATWIITDLYASGLPQFSPDDWEQVGATLTLKRAYHVGQEIRYRYRIAETDTQQALTPYDFGAIGNGIADDTDAINSLILQADISKTSVYFPKGTFYVTHVRNRTLENSLKVTCHPEARFVGAPTLVTVAGTGANTSYTVTEFPKAVAGYTVALISGGVVTGWTEGVQFTTTGTTVDWSVGSAPHGPLSIGDTIRIVSAGPMIELGQNSSTARNRIYWRGGYFDNSQRGFVPTRASGSALTIREFGFAEVLGMEAKAADDWQSAQAAGVGDSGLTILNCDNYVVQGNKFVGQPDLGLYLSGGASTGPEDDGNGSLVSGNSFIGCETGGKAERQTQDSIISNNNFVECRVCFLPAGLASSVGGGTATFSNNRAVRCGRLVDLRKVRNVVVVNNTIEDWGYNSDGVTAISSPVAIDLAGVEVGRVSGNIIRQTNWPQGSAVGIRLRAETTNTTVQTSQVVVEHNTVIGAATSFNETGSGVGNVWRENTTSGEATAVSVPSTRRWHYRKSNVEFEGIGTTPFEGPWTPEFRIGGTAPPMTITTQYGRYSRSGNVVEFECLLQVNPTFTPSGGQLRIYGLPFQALSTANNKGAGVLNGHAGLTYPAGVATVHAQIPNATSLANTFIRLNGVGSGIGGLLTDAQIVSGAGFRVDIHGSYAVEPETQN